MLVREVTNHGAADFALVLDDYHIITAESIQRGMTFQLEHLPPQIHLVLAARTDPPLPLARLLAQGQLTVRQVLRLLLEGASNREIARRLIVSVNTVKRHVYNICGKLGVQRRTQAIARTRDLNLL